MSAYFDTHHCQKMQLLLEKIAKNHDFGDFWWFSCFWHDVTYDVTVASYKVCLYFFWYQWTREGYSYPLVPNTWCFINWFPRSWGGQNPPPPGCEMGPKSPALLGLMLRPNCYYCYLHTCILFLSFLEQITFIVTETYVSIINQHTFYWFHILGSRCCSLHYIHYIRCGIYNLLQWSHTFIQLA